MQDGGTNARVVADSLDLQGAPEWAPDGQSVTSAADDHGVPHLFRVRSTVAPPFFCPGVRRRSCVGRPAEILLYFSGPDIGTTLSVKAFTADSAAHPRPP